jgi:coenzyme F420-0:L-glutamate ligase/coenzyme F420-1:gamma-L-glutamate ligase
MNIRISGLASIGDIQPGDELGLRIRDAAEREGHTIGGDTIVVVAQKIVSKAEGAIVDLRTVEPSPLADTWAAQWNRDPRLVELVFRQARRIVRMDQGVLIAETRHGLVIANAGVDHSNVMGEDFATVLPDDPDESARILRADLQCGAVIVSDTFGRPWREGLVNVAIGISGMEPLDDLRGSTDCAGKQLYSTVVAQCDELAAAAGLVMPKAGGIPVALIEGYTWKRGEGGLRPMLRAPERDLFR